MIARLFGTIISWEEDAIILRAGSVGYRVHLSPYSLSVLSGNPSDSSEISLYTQFFWSEHQDSPTLVGFPSKEEQDLFLLLRKVQGLGPMTALRILSLPVQEMFSIISQGDVSRLKTLKGVGDKTAKKIIAELKEEVLPLSTASIPLGTSNKNKTESLPDMASLVRNTLIQQFGHPPLEASRLVDAALKKRPEIGTIEELFSEVYRIGAD
jgi:Holliday junction DNA helicase RuvA